MRVRQLGWRVCYELLASRLRVPDWTFMNYGYAPAAGEAVVDLDPADEPDRLCIQLYARALGSLDLTGRDVLEVGSGRGGGCDFLWRSARPRSVTGLDFSARAVALCRRRWPPSAPEPHASSSEPHASGPEPVEGLTFVQGDAQALPFPDAAYDVVVNIESSHCYDSMAGFLTEVARVLRPGGVLAFADFRSVGGAEVRRRQLADSRLQISGLADITDRVVAALDLDDRRKAGLIDRHVPRLARRPFRRFAGMVGSTTYARFAEGEARYLTATLVRPE